MSQKMSLLEQAEGILLMSANQKEFSTFDVEGVTLKARIVNGRLEGVTIELEAGAQKKVVYVGYSNLDHMVASFEKELQDLLTASQ